MEPGLPVCLGVLVVDVSVASFPLDLCPEPLGKDGGPSRFLVRQLQV